MRILARSMEQVIVETVVHAPLEKVWEDYTNPESVRVWNAASPDWHTPRAENDLRTGGAFTYRMEARDGSEGFDFTGTYTDVSPMTNIAYVMDDGRNVRTTFTKEGGSVRVVTSFDPESENTPELQKAGWQAILDNFKRYVEGGD